jgi:ribosomal protein S18 acetylase RimI-like enzyme
MEVSRIARPAAEAFATSRPLPAVPGLVIRHLRRPDDYPAMNRIANAVRLAIGESFTTSDEQLAAYYDNPGQFDPDRDVAVFEVDGDIVGYARGGVNAELSGLRVYEIVPFVDPAADVDSYYPLMLAIIEDRLRELAEADPAPDKVLETFGGDSAPHLARHLEAAGFTAVRYGYVMVRPNLDDLPEAELPPGVEIREVRPEHLRPIWEAAAEAFTDAWGETEPTEADYQRYLTDPVESDSSLWRIAWAGDEIVGQVRSFINVAENEEHGRLRGYTESISVRRPWRRQGIAKALIVASLELLRERGMTEAALGVDTENVSGALRVYESCGFVPVSRTAVYRKYFSDPPAP